ncbi:hypothetical protein CBS101457_004611 [Exobasidium rhododendri]|nr:hypothetical protein CBS101457_004611 [Exobasidium rhododendri]
MAFRGKTNGAGAAAWNLDEADDPADWNETFSFLRELDASLRCELCYNILTAPVAVKDCNHVFCSLCVRNAINQPDPHGHHCPKCMTKNVHDSSLVPQPIIESAAEAWKLARPELFARQRVEQERGNLEERSQSDSLEGGRPAKRARLENSSQSHEVEGIHSSAPSRVTRSSSLRRSRQKKAEESIIVESDSEEDVANQQRAVRAMGERIEENKDYRSMQASDMVECPICNYTFTLVALNQHMDKGCNPGDPEPSPRERGLPTASAKVNVGGSSWFQRPNPNAKSGIPSTNGVGARKKKLARPNYTFVKDADVKRMLDEFKLSTSGSKDKLIDRHRQWVTLYNANLDASEKVQKNDIRLRREMAEWERSQEEGSNRNRAKAAAAMTEGKAKVWQATNEDQFRDLERRARESHFKNKAAHHQIQERQGQIGDGDGKGEDEVERGRSSSPTLQTTQSLVPTT